MSNVFSIPTAEDIAELVSIKLKGKLDEMLQSIEQKRLTVTKAEKTYVTRSEAEEIIGCKYYTINKLIKEGTLPYRKVGKKLLFKREDIYKLIESNSYSATAG